MCDKCQRDCSDCQRLLKKYGKMNPNLFECPYCGHLYYGDKCSCSGWEENEPS